MALLITPAEVLETAFPATEQFRDDLIRRTMIEVAQLQYLQPVFGALFDALEEERYSDFVSTYIKPPLAYYIRCMVIDELTASVGTLGILQEKSDYGSPASIRLQERLRRQARTTAERLLDRAVGVIEANPESFPEYDPEQNLRHCLLLKGGFIL